MKRNFVRALGLVSPKNAGAAIRGVFTLMALTTLAASASTVSFKAAQAYPVGTIPTSVAVGDFNGDGKPDLASADYGSNTVSILLGNGEGSFQAARNFDAGNSAWTYGIAVGDFNGDGKADVAVLVPTNGTVPAEIRVLMGNGDGTLQSPIVTTLSPQETIVAVVDVDGDRKADLMVNFSDASGVAGVEVLLGNGDGTFQTPKTVLSGQQQVLLAVADFDHDDKADLAIGVANSVQIMLGKGDGTFTTGGSSGIADGYSAVSARTADVNGDGTPDLIVHSTGPTKRCGIFNCTPTKESAFLSAGKGALGTEQVIGTSFPVAVGDFDGDGKLDIAGRTGSLFPLQTSFVIYPGNGDGTFAQPVTLPNPGNVVVGADLNGDQLTDLIVLEPSANDVAVVLNSTPTFHMTASANALTVSPGGEVTDTISFTQVNGFLSAIQLSCQVRGPAPVPTCSMSPGDIPAGVNSATVTMTINAPAVQSGLVPLQVPSHMQRFYALAIVLAFLGFAPGAKRVEVRSKRWLFGILLAALVFAEIGCGGSSGSRPLIQQQYSVHVTAASDTLTKTMQISLTVP